MIAIQALSVPLVPFVGGYLRTLSEICQQNNIPVSVATCVARRTANGHADFHEILIARPVHLDGPGNLAPPAEQFRAAAEPPD
jgi:hypothetical protein